MDRRGNRKGGRFFVIVVPFVEITRTYGDRRFVPLHRDISSLLAGALGGDYFCERAAVRGGRSASSFSRNIVASAA